MVSKLKPTFVTDEFIGAVADSLATGNAITLTTAVASATTYTDAQLSGLNYAGSQSATKNLTTNLNSAVVKADTNTIVIDVDLVNQNLNADFQISTVLINATYKGNNILVGVVRFSEPELFPAYDNISIYELEMKLYISVSRIADAKIIVNSAGMATAKSVQDLRTYVDGDFNADIARKTKDNIFTGTNTFNKKIIAPAGVQGNADTATKLQTPRKINGTNFDGTSDINVNAANDSNLVHRTGNENIAGIKSFSDVLHVGLGNFSGGALEISAVTPYIDFHFNNDTGDYTSRIVEEAIGSLNINGVRMKNGVITGSLAGNSDTATKLQTARLVGGVSFDGTSDIILPGVNAEGNQDTSGRAANATNADRANSAASADIANKAVALNTPRKINGTNFDGTADINVNAANDGILVHTGNVDEIIGGTKTFSGTLISNNPIKGSLDYTLLTDGTDFNTLTKVGKYRGSGSFPNAPVTTNYQYIVFVEAQSSFLSQVAIRFMPGKSIIYSRSLVLSVWSPWVIINNDDTVVHNTGNETIAGSKTFTDYAQFTKLLNAPISIRQVPNGTTKIADLVNGVISEFGNGAFGSVGYMSFNQSFTDAPNSSAFFLIEIATRGARTYLKIIDADNNYFIGNITSSGLVWSKISNDATVFHLSGDETAAGFKKFSGNIATTSDNSMINGGGNNGDIAFVKKNGGSGFIGIGSAQLGNTFRIKRSNNSSINPSDTFTDMFTVDVNGVVKAGTQQDLVPLDKNVAHNSGDETWSGNKTFSDTVTFNKKINGNIQINAYPLTTLQELATKMNTYAGEWVGGSNIITDMPEPGYANISVKPYGNSETAGTIILTYTESNRAFISYAKTPLSWLKISNDSTVVHNTGNEDISGSKNFKNPVTTAGIEIMAGTPFVDFHFGNDSGDYTSRIAEYVKGELNINSVKLSGGTISGTLNGNASSSTKLQTPRNINGVGFDGTSDITVDPALRIISKVTDLFTLENGFYLNTGVASTNKPTSSNWFVVEVISDKFNGFMRLIDNNGLSFWATRNGGNWGAWHQDADDATVVHNSGNETIGGSKTFSSIINGNLNGNSTTATKLQTARTIGGVSFDGSANINLPGVNTTGNQNTTGNAATATKLQFARNINGVSFDGSGDISVNAANDSNIVHKDNDETLTGNKTFSGVATFAKAQTASTIKKTITTNAPITLNFAETAFGVMVYASASGTFTADSTWKTLATLPTEISAPVQNVTLNDVDWAGIPNVSYRIGVGLKIAIKPNREITYKVTSLKENDSSSYNVGITFDTSTYWSK